MLLFNTGPEWVIQQANNGEALGMRRPPCGLVYFDGWCSLGMAILVIEKAGAL